MTNAIYENAQTIFSNAAHEKLMELDFYEMFGNPVDVINTTVTSTGYTKDSQMLDQNYGVDYRLIINKNKWNEISYTIQERFRHIRYKRWQDFTIRYETTHGFNSELSKINADYMVYGYSNNNKIDQIIVICIPSVKFAFGNNNLSYTKKTNRDNSKFVAFKFDDLKEIGAILRIYNME